MDIDFKLNKYFVYIILSVSFLVIYFGYLSPEFFINKKEEIEQQTLEYQDKIQKRATLRNELEEMREKAENIKQKTEEVQSKLTYNNLSENDLFKHISTFSEEHNLEVNVFQQTEKKSKGVVDETIYKINVLGSHNNILLFIDSFFRLGVIFSIEEYLLQQIDEEVEQPPYMEKETFGWSQKAKIQYDKNNDSDQISLFITLKLISVNETGR